MLKLIGNYYNLTKYIIARILLLLKANLELNILLKNYEKDFIDNTIFLFESN